MEHALDLTQQHKNTRVTPLFTAKLQHHRYTHWFGHISSSQGNLGTRKIIQDGRYGACMPVRMFATTFTSSHLTDETASWDILLRA